SSLVRRGGPGAMPAGPGRARLEAADLLHLAGRRIDQVEAAGAAGRDEHPAQARGEGEVVEADAPFAARQREGLRRQDGRGRWLGGGSGGEEDKRPQDHERAFHRHSFRRRVRRESISSSPCSLGRRQICIMHWLESWLALWHQPERRRKMRSWARLFAVPVLLLFVLIAADKPPATGRASAALLCTAPPNCIDQCYCDCRAAG